jgi:hypothetical protein
MTASVPRDPFAVAAGRIDPQGTDAPRIVPARLPLVATTPPVDLLPQAPEPGDAGSEQSVEEPLQPFRPLTRELTARHRPPESRAPRHDHLTPRYSRLAQSAVTFGPVGRVVLTVVLLGIPVFLLGVSLAWILFDGIYLFFLVPALRDVWQAVRVPVRPTMDDETAAASSVSGP